MTSTSLQFPPGEPTNTCAWLTSRNTKQVLMNITVNDYAYTVRNLLLSRKHIHSRKFILVLWLTRITWIFCNTPFLLTNLCFKVAITDHKITEKNTRQNCDNNKIVDDRQAQYSLNFQLPRGMCLQINQIEALGNMSEWLTAMQQIRVQK